jgi:hypothetical protein
LWILLYRASCVRVLPVEPDQLLEDELRGFADIVEGPRRLVAALHRISSVLLFAVVPLVVVLAVLGSAFTRGPFLYDFNGGLYGAGKDIVHGDNPYRPAYLAQQATLKRAGLEPETVMNVPVYPAGPLLAAVPFALLPYRIAGVLFALLSVGALLGALWFLGVRDWRCYGVGCVSWPVVHGLMLGALTPLLVFGAAIAWRFRHHLWPCACAIAALVSAKLFPWPLAVWLLVTRRIRTLVVVAALTAIATFGAWAVIGFDELRDYPQMLGDLSFVSEDVGVSAVAGLIALGVPAAVAKTVALLLTLALLIAAWCIAQMPVGARRAYGLAVIAALIASPVVWPHYLALLLVPIALAAPRLSWLWFTPLLAYAVPTAQTAGRAWIIPIYLAIVAAPLVGLCVDDAHLKGFARRRDAQVARLRPDQTAP